MSSGFMAIFRIESGFCEYEYSLFCAYYNGLLLIVYLYGIYTDCYWSECIIDVDY